MCCPSSLGCSSPWHPTVSSLILFMLLMTWPPALNTALSTAILPLDFSLPMPPDRCIGLFANDLSGHFTLGFVRAGTLSPLPPSAC